MVKPVNDCEKLDLEADHDPGAEPDAPLSGGALLDLPDSRVVGWGRTPDARGLGEKLLHSVQLLRIPPGLAPDAAGADGTPRGPWSGGCC